MSKTLFDRAPITIDVHFATKVGLNEAIVLQQIHYWLKTNEENKRNGINGRYWTYNTLKDWHKQLPFLNGRAVRSALENLREMEILVTGNFNQTRMDRTLWYSIDYKALDKFLETFVQAESGRSMEDEKTANAVDSANVNVKNDKCKEQKQQMQSSDMTHIPEKYQSNNNINNIYIVQAEQLWKMYPRKKGKAESLSKLPKLIKKHSYEQMERCISRYVGEVKGKEQEYILLGSTFFNKRYIDYLDENFEGEVKSNDSNGEPEHIPNQQADEAQREFERIMQERERRAEKQQDRQARDCKY